MADRTAVILLHDAIAVLHGPVPAMARQVARALETRDRGRVGGAYCCEAELQGIRIRAAHGRRL